jgi:hypothetical protein
MFIDNPRMSKAQNDYARSQAEFKDDSEQINQFRHMGRWVLAATTDAYCPRTGAFLCEQVTYIADYATLDEAEDAKHASGLLDGERNLEILSPINAATPTDDDPEIPF